MAGLFHEFLAHLTTTGVAKSSHFQVSIPKVPKGLDGGGSASRLLAMRCEATELPGRQLVTQDNRVYGPIYKTPYQSLYQDITLTFLETGDFFIRRYFELWLDTIFNSTNNRLEYPAAYYADMSMTQFDMTVKKGTSELRQIAVWHLVNAFPVAVNQMPVAWTEDGFHRVSVTFAYEYYELLRPLDPRKHITPRAGATPSLRKGSSTN